MNIEGLERIRQFLVSFGQTPPDNWTTYQVRTLAHHALQLSDEVERLQEELRISKLPDDQWLEEYHKRRKAAKGEK